MAPLDLKRDDWSLADIILDLDFQVEALARRLFDDYPKARALEVVVDRIRQFGPSVTMAEVVKVIEEHVGFFSPSLNTPTKGIQ